MSIREIRLYGDPVLREATRPVEVIDDGIRALVQDLLDTTHMEGRAGVAANQIGATWRVFSWHCDGELGYVINPVVEERSGGLREIGEGCLSVPGLWCETPRYEYCRVRGINLDGEEIVLEGAGLMAQILQHETDHLDGMVYLERLDKPRRREAMRELRETDWFLR